MEFGVSGGKPIPKALPDPAKWGYMGTRTVPGIMPVMSWAKRPDGLAAKCGQPVPAAGFTPHERTVAPRAVNDRTMSR